MSELKESPLPRLYAKWITEWLPEPLPVETEATCMDCPMFPGKNTQATSRDPWFSERTKCCTYIPTLPNYLAGAILQDNSEESAAGRVAFDEFFRTQAIVIPLGVHPPLDFHSMYDPNSSDFGRKLDLRCPYFLEEPGGLCGIWKHRNSRCSTWFCKHTRGNTGLEFWSKTDWLLSTLEEILSRWCVHELKVGSDEFRQTYPLSPNQENVVLLRQQMFRFRAGEVARVGDKSFYKDFLRWTWGEWLENEVEFFGKCYQLIEQMSSSEIADISGLMGSEPLIRVSESLKRWHSSAIPPNLRQGSFHIEPLDDTHTRVWAYHKFDFIDLPVEVMNLLPYFDGKSVDDIQSRIESEKGISIGDRMLRQLVDYKILVP